MDRNKQLEELYKVQNLLMNLLTDNARAIQGLMHPIIVVNSKCCQCLNKLDDMKAGKMVSMSCECGGMMELVYAPDKEL
jgi:hypothetical protein